MTTIRMLRRLSVVGLAISSGVALFPASANAQQSSCASLEGETIRWIVPYSPGGGYDSYSRLIEPVLEGLLQAEIAMVNMPGAGGMLGAKSIAAAEPDGKTIGLVNASGLLLAQLLGDEDVPGPTTELTPLGRVARDQTVWVARADSDVVFSDTGEVTGGGTPLLFGLTGVGSGDWFTIVIGRALLGLDAEVIVGYDGSQETQLGLIRGEFDVLDSSWSSVVASIENGEIRPIVQMTSAPIADHPSLANVPVFGGDMGMAAARAKAMGTDVEAARNMADGLVEVMGAGRIVVAPAALPSDVAACLQDRLHLALTDPTFTTAAASARRPLDVASGQDAAAAIAIAEDALPALQAIAEASR